jgi:hypothetical protein
VFSRIKTTSKKKAHRSLERKGKERKGKERKGKERKGKAVSLSKGGE